MGNTYAKKNNNDNDIFIFSEIQMSLKIPFLFAKYCHLSSKNSSQHDPNIKLS